jgi:hypothetical protein
MTRAAPGQADVMQVCENGHVITDLLMSQPGRGQRHCDRCGAPTLDSCPTCGQKIPGSVPLPGLTTTGYRRAPACCATCGAAFPWSRRLDRALPRDTENADLDHLLRRLPAMVRQMRSRYSTRPTFFIADEHDLEDVVRWAVALAADDVRLETRTPPYAPDSRTDLILPASQTIICCKLAGPTVRDDAIAAELREDIGYYRDRADCEILMVLVYDPEGVLREPAVLEGIWTEQVGKLAVRCIIAN